MDADDDDDDDDNCDAANGDQSGAIELSEEEADKLIFEREVRQSITVLHDNCKRCEHLDHMQSRIRDWQEQLKDLKHTLRKMKPLEVQKLSTEKFIQLKETAVEKVVYQIEALQDRRDDLYTVLDEAKEELQHINGEILKAAALEQHRLQQQQADQQHKVASAAAAGDIPTVLLG